MRPSMISGCVFPALFPLVAALAVAGCTPDSLAPSPDADPSRLYWALTLDHHAVTLSTIPPYDTLTLFATPHTVNGETLTGDTLTFTSSDGDRVQVDAHGVLRAIGPTQNVVVVATLTRGDLTHSDTTYVTVTTATPVPVLGALSIEPPPGDSAKHSLTGTFLQPQKALTAVLTDTAHRQLTGLAVRYESLDPTTANIDPLSGLITPSRVGPVTFTASATAYGVTRADTLDFTIGLPLLIPVTVQRGLDANGNVAAVFTPNDIVIGVGGDVYFHWNASTSPSTDVTFDDPSKVYPDDLACLTFSPLGLEDLACGTGNIAAFTRDTTPTGFLHNHRLRQFRAPGTYHFRSTIYGTGGTITVQAEPPANAARAARRPSSPAVQP